MTMTDPIADMLTCIRNALAARHTEVEVPHSCLKEGIARVLTEEGFLRAYKVVGEGAHRRLRIYLKYGPEGQEVIHEITRASRPGRRLYVGVAELPRVREGIGVAVVSTSQGIFSDRVCRQKRIGGEVLCTVW